MEQLKSMKEQLTSLVQGQLAHTDCVDTKELGEAVDMIKDLAEAIYYCTITKSMEEGKDEKQQPRNTYYYTERYYPVEGNQRMYYGGGQGNGSMSSGSGSSGMSSSRYYSEPYKPMWGPEYEYPMQMNMHDPREGRSPMTRRNYMESKEMHQGKEVRMKELEKYIKELGQDITEMIEDTTPDEKEMLKQKISTLADKIV